MSTFFPGSRNLSINGGNFSHVGRDQHNHYNNASASSANGQTVITQGTSSMTMMTVHVGRDQINHFVQQEKKEHTVFDDYRNIKRGDFYRLKDIGVNQYPRVCQCSKYRDLVGQGWKCEACCCRKVDKFICLAEVDGSPPGRVYTALSYSGPDARIAFEADFRSCTDVLSSQVAQLYAIDIGTVPSLLLRNELVPYAHFMKDAGLLGRWFADSLYIKWDCDRAELWIDSARGIICRGPAGPDSEIEVRLYREIGDAPSTVDLLHEDVFLRFLASKKSKELDRLFIDGWTSINRTFRRKMPESVNPNAAQVFSTLKNAPIAIAHHDLAWNNSSDHSALLDQTLLKNGLTRFRLGNGRWFQLGKETLFNIEHTWLSQAWSIFHALGITLENDIGDLKLNCLKRATLKGSLSQSRARWQRRLEQPIYLFVHPLPSNLPFYDKEKFECQTSSMHHWSFRDDGEFPLSCKTCRYFGLPTTLYLSGYKQPTFQWTNECYRIIHRYQHLGGFDPTTTDFARHLGCGDIVFQTVDDSIRFKELHEERITGSPEPHVDSHPEDVYDLDDYSLTALFDAGSDDDTYTNSAYISNIQERSDPQEDSLSSSDPRTQDPAVSMTSKLTTKTDHGANKRQTAGAGSGGEFEGIERREQHTDRVLECTTLSTLTTERPSLPSVSETVPFSDSTSPNVVLPTPSFPVQPTGSLVTSHSETHKEDGAQPISTYTNPNVSIGSDTIISNTDTHKNARWSTTSHYTNNNDRACNALAGTSNISSAVSYPPGSTIHTPVLYTTNTLEYTVANVSLTRPPVGVAQRYWIPWPFIPDIRSIARRSLWPVFAAPRSPTRTEDKCRNKDANEDLD
ncbi:hypothetical protein PQX77_019343 [Marasmius sp. AFHP31]|nr:hypothetical protein PQX77_019343 [Marasmius sp. AFHP31]